MADALMTGGAITMSLCRVTVGLCHCHINKFHKHFKDMDFLNMQTKGRNDNKERNVRKQMNNDNDKRKMHSEDKIRTK